MLFAGDRDAPGRRGTAAPPTRCRLPEAFGGSTATDDCADSRFTVTKRSSSLVWLLASSLERPGPDRDDEQRQPENGHGCRESDAEHVRIADPEHDAVAG